MVLRDLWSASFVLLPVEGATIALGVHVRQHAAAFLRTVRLVHRLLRPPPARYANRRIRVQAGFARQPPGRNSPEGALVASDYAVARQ